MASTFSPLLRTELIANGEQAGTWGATTNLNLGTLIEAAIAGTATIALPGGSADYTLTAYSGIADEARAQVLKIIATLTASRNVICPSVSKTYIVYNATSGAYTVTLKTATGTGVTIPQGAYMLVYCDGVNVVGAITALDLSTKTTPAAADSFVLADSAASNILKRLTWTNLVAALQTAWATLNVVINNVLLGYNTTVTAAGTTTLTSASAYQQFFTGTTTQTVTMPVTSTLILGQAYLIANNSTGAVTVNSSGGNLIATVPALTNGLFTCILTSGTTAASWAADISALLAGSATQTFSVAAATAAGDAVRKDQLPFLTSSALGVIYNSGVSTTSDLATYTADIQISIAATLYNKNWCSRASGGDVGNMQSTASVLVTGSSVALKGRVNDATDIFAYTLNFPTSGTYLVTATVSCSTYATNYSNWLTASAVRVS